jgi:hypothetical protein
VTPLPGLTPAVLFREGMTPRGVGVSDNLTIAQLRGRVAGLSGRDDKRADEARIELKMAVAERFLRKFMNEGPMPTPEQREHLVRLLRNGAE